MISLFSMNFSPIVQPWADFGNVIENWKEASINLLLLFPARWHGKWIFFKTTMSINWIYPYGDYRPCQYHYVIVPLRTTLSLSFPTHHVYKQAIISIAMLAQRLLFSMVFALIPCMVMAQDEAQSSCSFSCPTTDKLSQPLVKRPHAIGYESFYSIFECMCVNIWG